MVHISKRSKQGTELMTNETRIALVKIERAANGEPSFLRADGATDS